MKDRDINTGLYVILVILLGIALVLYFAAFLGKIVISFHV